MNEILGTNESTPQTIKKNNITKEYKPWISKQEEEFHEDEILKRIDQISKEKENEKTKIDNIYLTKELTQNFNNYIDEVVAEIKKQPQGIAGKIFDIDEIANLAKKTYGDLFSYMTNMILAGKNTEVYPYILSSFENAFGKILEKKTSWVSGWIIKKLANEKDFNNNKTNIKSRLWGKIQGMMLRTIRPTKLKIKWENPEVADKLTTCYENRTEYWDNQKNNFFDRIFDKTHKALFE